jgi:hypothetical protein
MARRRRDLEALKEPEGNPFDSSDWRRAQTPFIPALGDALAALWAELGEEAARLELSGRPYDECRAELREFCTRQLRRSAA